MKTETAIMSTVEQKGKPMSDNEKRSEASWRIRRAPQGGFEAEEKRLMEIITPDFKPKKIAIEEKYKEKLSKREADYLKFLYARPEDEPHKQARDQALLYTVRELRREIDSRNPMSPKVNARFDILQAMYENAETAEEREFADDAAKKLLDKAEAYVEAEEEIKGPEYKELWTRGEFVADYEELKYLFERRKKLEPEVLSHILRGILRRLNRYLRIVKEEA